MKLWQVDNPHPEGKATCCNGTSDDLFVICDTYEQAIDHVAKGNAGICACCMVEVLVNHKYEIQAPVQEIQPPPV